eukprot:3914258-Prymnesium_polylepis.1
MRSRVGRADRAARRTEPASPQPQPAFGGAQCPPRYRRRRAGWPPLAAISEPKGRALGKYHVSRVAA